MMRSRDVTTVGALLGAGVLGGAVLFGGSGCEGSCEEKRNCGPYDGPFPTTSSVGGASTSSSVGGGGAGGNIGGAGGTGVGGGGAPPAEAPRGLIAVGFKHSCSRRADGTLRCWGNNVQGQVGNGLSETSRTSPSAVQGVSDAVKVAVGSEHSCALQASGVVRCWGGNSFGQLGNGTTNSSLTSVSVLGVTDAVELASGDTHVCARRGNGRISCWGSSGFGQLGDGDASLPNKSTPVEVLGISDAVSIASGQSHTCAVRSNVDLIRFRGRFG